MAIHCQLIFRNILTHSHSLAISTSVSHFHCYSPPTPQTRKHNPLICSTHLYNCNFCTYVCTCVYINVFFSQPSSSFRPLRHLLIELSIIFSLFAGRPQPKVTWWNGNKEIDQSSHSLSDRRVGNILTLGKLTRQNLHMQLTCQAANNNLTTPITSTVTLDLNRKWWYEYICAYNVRNSKKEYTQTLLYTHSGVFTYIRVVFKKSSELISACFTPRIADNAFKYFKFEFRRQLVMIKARKTSEQIQIYAHLH